MRSVRRRASLVGFVGMAAAIGIGSYAWACSPNSPHTALFWLCNQGFKCSSIASLSSAPSNSVKWGRATGLSTGTVTYDAKWVSGSFLPPSDSTCENGPNTFLGGSNLLPDGTGAIDFVTLTMPNFLGLTTKCLVPAGYVTAGSVPATLKAASHSLLTLT